MEQVRLALKERWKGLDEFKVVDLPNGYYFINCESQEMQLKLIFDGPWTMNGLILQLAPWQPNFQPTFSRLSTAAVWIQLYHLPAELWEGDILETIAAQFGKLLRIDELTLNLSRAKYARVCVELGLSQPLKRGVWIGDKDERVFIVALYERLQNFCCHCGVVGHGAGVCNQCQAAPFKARTAPNLSTIGGRGDVQERKDEVLDPIEVDAVGSEVTLPADPSCSNSHGNVEKEEDKGF